MRDPIFNPGTYPPSFVRRCRFVALLAVLLGCLFFPAPPAFAQSRAERRRDIRHSRRMRARQVLRRQSARRAGFFDRLRDLPPKEQERVLKNDRRFRELPPERRQKIRENLLRWNELSPEQKAQVRRREQVYSHFSPQQRQNVREMYGKWRGLGPTERRRVRMALRRMRAMTPEERTQFLDSPQFSRRFSPEEQRIVRGLVRLFPSGDAPDQ